MTDIKTQEDKNFASKLMDAGQKLQRTAIEIVANNVGGGDDIKEVMVDLETMDVKFVTAL